jgi:hypothetical protein
MRPTLRFGVLSTLSLASPFKASRLQLQIVLDANSTCGESRCSLLRYACHTVVETCELNDLVYYYPMLLENLVGDSNCAHHCWICRWIDGNFVHGLHVRNRPASVSRRSPGSVFHGFCSRPTILGGGTKDTRRYRTLGVPTHVLLRVCLHWTLAHSFALASRIPR